MGVQVLGHKNWWDLPGSKPYINIQASGSGRRLAHRPWHSPNAPRAWHPGKDRGLLFSPAADRRPADMGTWFYGIGRIDASGRVADRVIAAVLRRRRGLRTGDLVRWRPGPVRTRWPLTRSRWWIRLSGHTCRSRAEKEASRDDRTWHLRDGCVPAGGRRCRVADPRADGLAACGSARRPRVSGRCCPPSPSTSRSFPPRSRPGPGGRTARTGTGTVITYSAAAITHRPSRFLHVGPVDLLSDTAGQSGGRSRALVRLSLGCPGRPMR